MGSVLWRTDDEFGERNPRNQRKRGLDDCQTARHPRQMGGMKPRGRGMVAFSSNGARPDRTLPLPRLLFCQRCFSRASASCCWRLGKGKLMVVHGRGGQPVATAGLGAILSDGFFEGLRESGGSTRVDPIQPGNSYRGRSAKLPCIHRDGMIIQNMPALRVELLRGSPLAPVDEMARDVIRICIAELVFRSWPGS